MTDGMLTTIKERWAPIDPGSWEVNVDVVRPADRRLVITIPTDRRWIIDVDCSALLYDPKRTSLNLGVFHAIQTLATALASASTDIAVLITEVERLRKGETGTE